MRDPDSDRADIESCWREPKTGRLKRDRGPSPKLTEQQSEYRYEGFARGASLLLLREIQDDFL